MPEVRLAYRWRGGPGTDAAALRTPFPADLAPGEQQIVPVSVVAPPTPGRYRLDVDLVHEYERWFGVGFELDVEVVPRRLVALLGSGEELAGELDRLLFEPELEPLVVEPGEEVSPQRFGHARVPGLRTYLLRGVEDASRPRLLLALAWRTHRLTVRARQLRQRVPAAPLQDGAEAFLLALERCERLIVVSRDPDAPTTRELWRFAATVRAANALGVAVEVRPGALAGASPGLDRMLARDVRRHARS
jgi:hypothetical protein